MNQRHMYRFFISGYFLLFFVSISGQQDVEKALKDSIAPKTSYGIRLGVDLSKPIRSLLQNYTNGIELVGDYRISKKWFIATEVGMEKFTSREDFTNITSEGNYVKIGLNFNSYNNLMDMNNEIFMGFRYGFSMFEETINSHQINTGSTVFPVTIMTSPLTLKELTAHWFEFQLGLKVEIQKNVFVAFSSSYKIMINHTEPVNFNTHYAPGFNRIYASNTGFGFHYTISYLIPFINK